LDCDIPGRAWRSGEICFSYHLESWTNWPDPEVRYFSGTATYVAYVAAPTFTKSQRVLLHFQDVREIARVKVNGKYAGTIWAKPFALRVDQFLKPGENILELEVTNLWPNRVIGDLQDSSAQRYTETNIKSCRSTSPLLPAGLIGRPEWQIEE
jgi:Glycosyl hydrolases family 2, sugar binding domain